MNLRNLVLGVVALASLPGGLALGQEDEIPFQEERDVFTFHTVWDFRYIRTDRETSWLDRGLGKTRFGGEGREPRNLFRLPQASFVADLEPLESLSVHAQVNLDLEPEIPGGRYGWDRLRLIELFADWRLGFADDAYELGAKGGFFFPPISLENIGEAWTTPFTITPSAINAWIGEEVKVTGAEVSLARVGLENEIRARGSVFWNNDPTGSLLAYRGFALHDRQTGARDRVPLPPIPSIEPGGDFARQAPWVEPVQEIDDRAGYYAGLDWTRYRRLRVNGLYFDSRGVPTAFDGDQYAWETRFTNVGALVFLPGEAELFGQFLDGNTFMGFRGSKRMDVDFRAWYALVTAPIGRHRFTLRYDRFETRDRDPFVAPDGGNEDGHGWTLAYSLGLFGEHRVFAELLRVWSDRPARSTLGLAPGGSDLQFQLSLRLVF